MNILKTFAFLSLCVSVSSYTMEDNNKKRKHDEIEQDSQQMRDTRLLIAVTAGNIEEIKKELANGANASGVINFKHTPIQRAIARIGAFSRNNITEEEESRIIGENEKKALEIVQLLCQHNANPNVFTQHTRHSPLQLATYYQQPSIIQTLLQHGADINAGKPWLNVIDDEIANIYIQHGIGETIDQVNSENCNILNRIIATRTLSIKEKEGLIKIICKTAFQYGRLTSLLEHKNNDKKTPHQLAVEPEIKELLDPKKAYQSELNACLKNEYQQSGSKNIFHHLILRELTGRNPWQ
ncbi:MAG: ankyrin repeat domain-containing protein [Candidatus Babeliales bacterium]